MVISGVRPHWDRSLLWIRDLGSVQYFFFLKKRKKRKKKKDKNGLFSVLCTSDETTSPAMHNMGTWSHICHAFTHIKCHIYLNFELPKFALLFYINLKPFSRSHCTLMLAILRLSCIATWCLRHAGAHIHIHSI